MVYDVTGFNVIGLPLTTAVKFNWSSGTLDTYTQNDDGGFGSGAGNFTESNFNDSNWSSNHLHLILLMDYLNLIYI